MLAAAEVRRICEGRHGDPFAVLGPHHEASGRHPHRLRVFLPGAQSVQALASDGSVVAKLTRIHEARIGEAKPWKMTDSARDYIDAMLKAIVGIEIEILSIVGKSKLSQNREERDRLNVVQVLAEREATDMSSAVLKAMTS